MRKVDYRAMIKDIYAEQKDLRLIGKDRARMQGITFSTFKERLSELHTWPCVLTRWYQYFNDYCASYGAIKEGFDLSISEWAEEYFIDWKEETHRTELKSKTPEIQ